MKRNIDRNTNELWHARSTHLSTSPSHPDANVDWIPSRRRSCHAHVCVWINCSVCIDSTKSNGLHFSFASHSRWKRSIWRARIDECQLFCRRDNLTWTIGWLWHISQIKSRPNNTAPDQMLPLSLSWLTFEILLFSFDMFFCLVLNSSSSFHLHHFKERQPAVSVVFRRYFRSALITSKDRTALVSIEAKHLNRRVNSRDQYLLFRSIDRVLTKKSFQFFSWPVPSVDPVEKEKKMKPWRRYSLDRLQII